MIHFDKDITAPPLSTVVQMISVGVRRPGYVDSTYQVENITPTFKSNQLENSEQSKEKIIK